MYSGLIVLCLVALSHAMPESVKMFEIKHAPLRLRFDPYEDTWQQFKKDHGEISFVYTVLQHFQSVASLAPLCVCVCVCLVLMCG